MYYYSTESESEEVISAENYAIKSKVNSLQKSNLEVNLYPLLSIYVNTQHNVFAKRIDEKTSSNSRGPNGNKWLFPDLVGIEDFGHDWNDEIKKCVKEYADKRSRLWSFEVKVLLNRSNVRESWFQTVSNSSWANFGYLVASQIAADSIKELRILSAVHGIGVIRLDVDNPAESEILIPAKEKFEIDWDTCDRLVNVLHQWMLANVPFHIIPCGSWQSKFGVAEGYWHDEWPSCGKGVRADVKIAQLMVYLRMS